MSSSSGPLILIAGLFVVVIVIAASICVAWIVIERRGRHK
jgi:hypothetical protein